MGFRNLIFERITKNNRIMILLHWDNFATQIFSFFALWLLPPLIMIIVGIAQPEEKREIAKILHILALIYFLIGGDVCFSMI